MPGWVRERTDRNAGQNVERVRAAEALYRAIQEQLSGRGIGFLALKGRAHCPDFTAHPQSRVQYDIDLFVPEPDLTAARDAILGMGYESFEEMERFPTDHLPPLIRKTGWQWRDDFFDPEIPYSIEIHFRFWNPDLERLPIADVECFWSRRVSRQMAGAWFNTLAPADAVGYACLHVLKHVLRGSAKPFHLYEVGSFLQSRAADGDFWSAWRRLHSAEFRRLQAVVFRLAEKWFGCEIGCAAREEAATLPRATKDWFARPDLNPFGASKDELGLHLSLVRSNADGWAVIRRRLFPARLPGPVDAVHIPNENLTIGRRLQKQARYLKYLTSRAWRHAVALPQSARTCFRWWWRAD